MTTTKNKRRNRFISGSFQLRLVGSFVGLAGVALLLQFLMLGFRLASQAARLDGGGGDLAGEIPRMLLEVFVFTLAVLLPVIFGFAVNLTFRVAGPIHRFSRFLAAVAAGEETEPCRIRESDQLHELCELINRATAPVRERNAATDTAHADGKAGPEPPPPMPAAAPAAGATADEPRAGR